MIFLPLSVAIGQSGQVRAIPLSRGLLDIGKTIKDAHVAGCESDSFRRYVRACDVPDYTSAADRRSAMGQLTQSRIDRKAAEVPPEELQLRRARIGIRRRQADQQPHLGRFRTRTNQPAKIIAFVP